MEYLKLIGIVIIVLGFALKFDVLATVLLAGLVTGIVAGMDIPHILSILGESFVSNRLMSIFLIIFPVIAIIERYGLKDTNSRNKTEWMQVIHIGYRNRKPLYLFNDVKERYVAARRLGIDIGFYEITGTDSKTSYQFRYLLFNSVK